VSNDGILISNVTFTANVTCFTVLSIANIAAENAYNVCISYNCAKLTTTIKFVKHFY